MTPALIDVQPRLIEYQVVLERHGNRIKWRAAATPPADLMAALRKLKPVLLSELPDLDARAIVRFRAPSSPPGSWCTALGSPGITRGELVADLLKRWPDSEIRPEQLP